MNYDYNTSEARFAGVILRACTVPLRAIGTTTVSRRLGTNGMRAKQCDGKSNVRKNGARCSSRITSPLDDLRAGIYTPYDTL